MQNFLAHLRSSPDGAVFNPWYESDRDHDQDPGAPSIRREHLYWYLENRRQRATHLLIGEAIGYQGGHFSGIPMTSERILLGQKQSAGIDPNEVFNGVMPRRTSDPAVKSRGFTENTATIVWKALRTNDIDPYSIILWNTFPWHPYDAERGLLSNRTPTGEEFAAGRPHLEQFLELYRDCTPVALGRHARQQLRDLGCQCAHLRHPAHGGAPEFRAGLRKLFS
ncbi:MAG TPA: uracil-DNA glycosylase [bacterium]|nr:uracil-DNA glycosylase [bacterium]